MPAEQQGDNKPGSGKEVDESDTELNHRPSS
jgi:hypothetical protein